MVRKKIIVISLGGSLIIPDNVNYSYLKRLKKVLTKNTNKHKFIVVCGGGSIARKYIEALKKQGLSHKLQSMAGISATRMNARFMTHFFGKDPKKGIAHSIKQLKQEIKNNDIIFCGALRYQPNQTSDGTAAEIAREFKAEFINLTNVAGLYTQNPKKHKNAKFIPKTTWKDFNRRANKLKYKPGQHFVLDQSAAKIILKSKIKTYIIGQNLRNLQKLLKHKKFKGTIISG